jgi:hypothetical protein
MDADHAAMMINIYSIYSVNFGDLAGIDTQPHGLGVCCCSDASSQQG